ncbi:MAG: hypothetical protein ACOYM7_03930 [Paludibacter sp.]
MARLKLHYKVIVSIIFTAVLAACTTQIDWDNQFNNLSLDQSYIIPLGETTMSLENILDQYDSLEFINRTENNVYVLYKDTNDWKFREMADLSNLEVLIDEFFPSPITASLQNQTVTKDIDHTLTLGFNENPTNQRIDRAEMNSAKLQIQLNVENITIQPSNIRVTTFFLDNTIVFENGDTKFIHNPTVLNAPEIITLHPFKMNTPGSLNKIKIKVQVDVIAGNTPILASPLSKIGINYKLYDVNSKVYYGFFSPTIAIESQEKIVDMSEFISELPHGGIFKLAEPSITMDVYNNTGLKIGFNIDSIKAFSSTNPSFVPVYAKFNNSKSTQHVVDRVQTYGGTAIKSSFILDYTLENGDISHFFDKFPLPNKLLYKFKINNARTVSDPLDFMIPNGEIKAIFSVKVPLKMNAGSQFILHDTLKNVNLEEALKDDQVDKAQLVLKVTNGLPLRGVMSLNFLSATKQIIPDLQLLSDSTVKAPEINADGTTKAGSKAVSYINFVIQKSQIPRLKLAKNIAYSFKVESEENQKITLQKTDSLKLKLGVYLKGDNIVNF